MARLIEWSRYAKIKDSMIKEHTRGQGCEDPRLLDAFQAAYDSIAGPVSKCRLSVHNLQ